MDFVRLCAVFGSGIAMGLGAIGSAVGEGYVAMNAVQALGRQPNASGKLLRVMLIAQAVTETASIFALVIAILLIFRNNADIAVRGYAYIAAGIAIGFGTIGSGIGAGLPGGAACEGIGRQPKNENALTVHMIIGQTVSQTSTIFALTIALILIFKPLEIGLIKILAVLGAGCAIGFGAIGPGVGVGIVARYANLAIGKNPAYNALLTRTMLIGQAVTETTVIYSVVVAIILLFVS